MAELPQFSRNYGSKGGAYESPVTAIDASGKEYARAIANIGNSVARVIQQKTNKNSTAVKETQKYLDYNAKFVLENYDEFSANMERVGVNNPSLNKAGLFAIEKKAQAYMVMKSSTSKENQMAAAREYALWDGKINELTQLIQAGKDANESYYSDYVDGYPKVNTEGGVSTTNQNVGLSKQYQLAMPARIGATRNPEEQWFFDENDNWKIKTAYSSEQITQAYKNGEIKNNYVVADPKVLFAFDGGKIPNITADRNKFLEESDIFKNGKFGDDYVSEPELKTTENKQFEYTFRPSKFAEIETAATPFITAQINSFLKFPEKAKNIWSHVLNGYAPEGTELNYANGQVGTAFDEESSKVFGEAYTAWFLEDLKEKGGNASNYNKITKDEPTEGEIKIGKAVKESESNYNIAKKLINQEGKIPDVPAQPNFFDVSGQLTNEGNRFKEAMSAIVTGSNGKLVEFVESERTGEPSARVKYPGQPEIEISLAEFRNKDLFDAKIQKFI
jgi:hypothetical protein